MPAMNIASIVAELKSERDRLDTAIKALTGLNGTGRSATGTRGPAKRSKAGNEVSRLAQNLRWARQLKKGPAAMRAAERALRTAQAKLTKKKG